MVDERSEYAKEYLAGASLAFGLVLLTFQVLNAYYAYTGVGQEVLAGYAEAFFTLFLGVHITGGVLGGYLVGRRRKEKTIQAGVFTGLIAYIIEFIYYLIFEGSFPGSPWAVLSFVGGGTIGAYLAAVQRQKRPHDRLARSQQSYAFEDMLEEIEEKIEETEAILAMRGYRYERVEPREFFDYMTGETPTGDTVTLRDVLDNRYLLVHELVEMSELKKRGIPLGKETVTTFHPEVYEAHMNAFEFELDMAVDEGDQAWVEQRLKLVDSWLEDESMPSHLASVCRRLMEKFSGNLKK
jgi:hypothetical protein